MGQTDVSLHQLGVLVRAVCRSIVNRGLAIAGTAVNARTLAERVDVAGGNAVVLEVLIGIRGQVFLGIDIIEAGRQSTGRNRSLRAEMEAVALQAVETSLTLIDEFVGILNARQTFKVLGFGVDANYFKVVVAADEDERTVLVSDLANTGRISAVLREFVAGSELRSAVIAAHAD